jgi:L-serine dehydratase
MALSVFDLFKVGVGPSSSHTVGPMHAAYIFRQHLETQQQLSSVNKLKIQLFGSLSSTDWTWYR